METVLEKILTHLVRDAVDYPLAVRIAAWLHNYGCTMNEYASLRHTLEVQMPDQILVDIETALQEFKSGRRPILARLTSLVEKL